MTTEHPDPRLLQSGFRPPGWLRHRHLQTIYPTLPWAYSRFPGLRREILTLPDGDETAVDWLVEPQTPAARAPILVILHGLEGSARSSYARMLMIEAARRDWHACVMHFRDCGDYSNRLPRRYHAGETNDVRFFLNRLAESEKYGPIAAAGFSLGGNVLLKYLGEPRRHLAQDAKLLPYRRIAFTQIELILGALLVEQSNQPLLGLVVLLAVKIAIDLHMQRRERKTTATV